MLRSDVPRPAPKPRLVGREDLLATVESQLAVGASVVLTGSSGIGKTALMDAVGAFAAARGERVLRVAGTETDRWISCSVLADLLTQIPPHYLSELPDPQRAAVNGVLLRGGPSGGGSRARLARRMAWLALVERCAEDGPVLLLIDDAQWLDAASADVMTYAGHRIKRPEIRAVVAERWSEQGAGQQARAAALVPSPVLEIVVPPLTAADLAELLDLYALPARMASKLHADSGGNPYLALALGGAFADEPATRWLPVQLPQRIHAVLRDRASALPSGVRETLLYAAVATSPTIELLLRAGRAEAEQEIRLASAAGLLVTDGNMIRFTPPAVASVITGLATGAHRSAVHTAVAAVVSDNVERARHRALASADPDAGVARSLVTAAEDARRRSARGLAAELYLLAADRTPPELHVERLEWCVAAAELGAAASRPEIVNRAAEAVMAADSSPAHRVRVRMALIDLSGQALADMDEAFAAAAADADDDPALMAPLRLRLSWQAMIDGHPMRGESEADKAASHAHEVGDTSTEAMALAVRAQVARMLGRADYAEVLDRALALPPPPTSGLLHLTPRYLAARFAIFDDRLGEARDDLLQMLALVERGAGEEIVEVLRSLSEVSVRSGRLRDGINFADRALRIGEEAGLSPGPAWHNIAVAELAGGSLVRAARYAERGVRASEQERDSIYLSRSLHVLGQAKLRSNDIRGAVESLQRVRTLELAQGVVDPSILRWHGDLALGLIAVGELDEAERTIQSARSAIAIRRYNSGVTAQLARADSLLHAERGQVDAAVELVSGSIRRFDLLRQPIERGHSLLVLGQIERRRRRHAAARVAVSEALALFTDIAAKPWVEQASRSLARVDGTAGDATASSDSRQSLTASDRVVSVLTATEQRIANMVREGSSNREIATRMFLSVKTVEAALTRIYRKLGVRSRTQLSSRLTAE